MRQTSASNFRRSVAATLAIVASAVVTASAGQPMKDGKTLETTPFDKGMHEFQIGVGAFTSLNSGSDKRPDLTDVDLNLRFGWMLYTPSGDGAFRGNLEFLLDVFGAGIVDGPGDVIAGGNVLLRYNFVQPSARLVPYFQLGGGGVYTNAHTETPQRELGGAFEFNLQTSFGLRIFCSERHAFFIEGGYRHLSNAGIYDRNLGLNSLGGLVGASWFF